MEFFNESLLLARSEIDKLLPEQVLLLDVIKPRSVIYDIRIRCNEDSPRSVSHLVIWCRRQQRRAKIMWRLREDEISRFFQQNGLRESVVAELYFSVRWEVEILKDKRKNLPVPDLSTL